jgi:acyl-CoA dehydrogenase
MVTGSRKMPTIGFAVPSHARARAEGRFQCMGWRLKPAALCAQSYPQNTTEHSKIPRTMDAPKTQQTAGLSNAERDMLRDSVRDLLAKRWPAERAVEASLDGEATAAVWRALAGQGLAALGGDATGLRDALVAFEELGRASCPAPLLGAVAANLALAGERSNSTAALLEDMHQGNAAIALALGAFDGDPAAGRVAMHDGAVRGRVSFVEGALAATHFLIFTNNGLAIVARGAAGLAVTATPGLAVPALSELAFESTPALACEASSERLADIAAVARLACAGRALGAAQRAFEMAVEHAKVRKQFGQLIGQFQAVQHKLADCLTSLDGARLAIESAADARDSGNPDWRVFAAAALAFAGPALREVSIQTHRALGAIGYAEEHEAPRHFRRVHADLARFGGVSRARAELADFVLGPAT